MAEQVFYEDVEEGLSIPDLIKNPSKRQLVKWAAASGDFNELHYDKDLATSLGFPDVILHGRLKAAFLGQLITDWIGERGNLRKLSCSYRRNDLPGQELTCRGRVTRKYVQNSDHMVECEIWTESLQGEQTTPGTATVVLPSRG